MDCRDRIIWYISTFLYELDGTPFEYYYLNQKYPKCTVDNLSDKEIARQYPKSGERLILDCWGLLNEYDNLSSEDLEPFIRVIDSLIQTIEKEQHES